MLRRDLLRGLALAPFAKRPNILFLFTDDQRFNTIHALNNAEIRTPNLDRLVRRGTSFTRAHIMGGTIGAVCAPSRAMLMTGQTLFHVDRSIVRPEQAALEMRRPFVMFPEFFQKAGYRTYGIGKWHNGPALYARCFQDGANIFFGGMDDHAKTQVQDFDPSGRYGKERVHPAGAFSSTAFSDSAIGFLKQQRGEQPFLMYVAYTAPHDPRMAPKAFAEMYPAAKMKVPENFLPVHPFDNGELKVRDELLAPFPRTQEVVREHLAAYYAMITHVDAEIGRVLDTLESTGQAENTIVVFAGDNGLAVGQHGLMGKQNLYDHSVRVPLVFAGPGIPRNETRDALCYLLDVFPTLCELTGEGVPGSVEGRSLAPVMRKAGTEVRDSVFYAYRDVQRGVRQGDWKLIVYRVEGRQREQLFDLANDPLERVDLSANEKWRGKRRELWALLQRWQRETDDAGWRESSPQ